MKPEEQVPNGNFPDQSSGQPINSPGQPPDEPSQNIQPTFSPTPQAPDQFTAPTPQPVTADNSFSNTGAPQQDLNSQVNPVQPAINPAPETYQPSAQPSHDPFNVPRQTPQPQSSPVTPTLPDMVSFNSGKIKKSRPLGNKRMLGFIVGGIVLLILAIGGFVFGYYLPNKPENVWNTGLDRSGQAIEKIVEETTKKEKLEAIKKSDIAATMDIKGNGVDYSGSVDVKFDDKKSNGKLTLSDNVNGDSEQKLAIEFLSELAEKQTYPDTYMKFSGLTALGLQDLLPGIEKYENKWIGIESKYIESLLEEEEGEDAGEQITAEDIAELSRAFVKPTNEYVMTSDEKKSVLTRKAIVGEEKVDNITAFHYKAGINKENAKSYCEALINSLYSTQVVKKTIAAEKDTDLEKEKKDEIESCKKSIDEDFKDDETFDVWIDKKYKLLHKIRIYDEGNSDAYFDVGQKYKGGDEMNIFIKYFDDESKSEVLFTVNTNIKSNQTTGELKAKFGEGDEKIEANLKMTAKPYTGEIKVDKPKDIVPIKDVLSSFGLSEDEFLGGGTINQKAEDSERQTDINAMHSQVEAYYAQYGWYPGLSEMNDQAFVKKNLVGLSSDAMIDPLGTTPTLAAGAATFDKYGYDAKQCDKAGKKCQSYTLEALLNTGSKYSKSALN